MSSKQTTSFTVPRSLTSYSVRKSILGSSRINVQPVTSVQREDRQSKLVGDTAPRTRLTPVSVAFANKSRSIQMFSSSSFGVRRSGIKAHTVPGSASRNDLVSQPTFCLPKITRWNNSLESDAEMHLTRIGVWSEPNVVVLGTFAKLRNILVAGLAEQPDSSVRKSCEKQ